MSRSELLVEIERLRADMVELAEADAEFSEMLRVSQALDRLIVLWHKAAAA